MYIKIRRYKENEITDLWNLYFNTIHNVNTVDYSKEQIDAWAPKDLDESIWQQKIISINPYVAIIESKIVGYGDVQNDGLIDHFFCHHKFQGKGVGSKLYSWLERIAIERNLSRVYSEVSKTARPFFLSKGFKVIEEQTLSLRGQNLINYKMSKRLYGS